jgi:hypothetical protein
VAHDINEEIHSQSAHSAKAVNIIKGPLSYARLKLRAKKREFFKIIKSKIIRIKGYQINLKGLTRIEGSKVWKAGLWTGLETKLRGTFPPRAAEERKMLKY